MKRVDSSVISEPVEFIFNLLNVVATKHSVFSYETAKCIPNTMHSMHYSNISLIKQTINSAI